MKIDLVHRYYNVPGGVTVSVKEAIKEYEKQGLKYNLIYDESDKARKFLRGIGFYYNAVKKLRKSNSDIVLTNSYPICFFKRLIKKPIVLIIRGGAWERYNTSKRDFVSFLSAYLRTKSFKKADKLFSVSHMMKEILIRKYGVSGNKVVVIPNGVDYNLFEPKEIEKDNKFKVLQIKTLKIKGFDLLVKWAPELIRQNKDISFLVIGKKKDLPEKISLYFKFISWIDYEKMPELYNSADLIIAPSRFDTFLKTGLESMSCGKPTLVSNNCGMKDLIKEGKNGFVSNLEDFDKKIVQIMKMDKKDLNEIGKNARETAMNYGWDSIVKKQIKEFKKCRKI